MRGFLFTFPVLCQQPSYIKFVRNSQPYLFIVVKTMMNLFFRNCDPYKGNIKDAKPYRKSRPWSTGVLECWKNPQPFSHYSNTPVLQSSEINCTEIRPEGLPPLDVPRGFEPPHSLPRVDFQFKLSYCSRRYYQRRKC